MGPIIRLIFLQILLLVITISAKSSLISDQHHLIRRSRNLKIVNNGKDIANNVRLEDNCIHRQNETIKWIETDKMLKRFTRKDQLIILQSKLRHRVKHRVTRSNTNNNHNCQLKDITDRWYRWVNASHVYLSNNTNMAFKVVYAKMRTLAASNQTIIQILICTEVRNDNWNESIRVLNYITPTLELFCYTPLVIMHVMMSRLHERFDYCFLSVLIGMVGYKLLRLAGSFLQQSPLHSISSCYVLAIFRHYFLAVTYASIIIVAFDIKFYFARHTPPDSEGLLKIYYICCAWLIPAMLSVTLFSINYVDISYHIKDGSPRCAIVELWARILFILIPCLIAFIISIAFACVAKKVLRSRKLKHRRASTDIKLMARKYHRIIQYTTAVMIITAGNMLLDSIEVTVAIQQRIVQLHVSARIVDILCALTSIITFIAIFNKWLKGLKKFNNYRYEPTQTINHRVQSYDINVLQ